MDLGCPRILSVWLWKDVGGRVRLPAAEVGGFIREDPALIGRPGRVSPIVGDSVTVDGVPHEPEKTDRNLEPSEALHTTPIKSASFRIMQALCRKPEVSDQPAHDIMRYTVALGLHISFLYT